MDEAFIRDPSAAPRSRELTARQREVLQMLAEGKSMKEIAFILDVKLRTVQFHKFTTSYQSLAPAINSSCQPRRFSQGFAVFSACPSTDRVRAASSIR